MKFLKKVLPFIVIFFSFFIIVFVINAFPHGYFVGGGDYFQYQKLDIYVSRFFYFWMSQLNQGGFNTLSVSAFFYLFFSLVETLGFTVNVLGGVYIFTFLVLTFCSMYLSLSIFFSDKNLDKKISIGMSLVYALNAFTEGLFKYPWGYTHHILFYIFLPPLFLLFLKIILTKELLLKYYLYFGTFFIFSIISYNNLAFFLFLLFIQFISLIILLLVKKISFSKNLLFRLLIICIFYFVTFGWFVFAFYFSTKDYAMMISKTKAFGGDSMNIVRATSSSLINLLRFDLNGFGFKFNYLSSLYMILMLFLLSNIREKVTRMLTVFLIIFFIVLILAVRIHYPFDWLNNLVYKTYLFQFFRSPDKIFITIPFFYVLCLTEILRVLQLKRKYLLLVFSLLLIIPYSFYFGGIKDSLSTQSKEGYTYLVSIPKNYYGVEKEINSDWKETTIISLPHSVVNSINWVNYPMWHYVGADPIGQLYDKNYISANSYDHPFLETEMSFDTYNLHRQNSNDLLKLFQKFSGEYIFYHKDIDPKWIKKTKHVNESLVKLTKEKKLTLVVSNSYFDLYRVTEKYIAPLIYSKTMVAYHKLNPTKYKIYATVKGKQNIVFNQTYSSQWKLFIIPKPTPIRCETNYTYQLYSSKECNGKKVFFQLEDLTYIFRQNIFDNKHTMVNKYANAWEIDQEYIQSNYPEKYYKKNIDGSITVEFVMYYLPQSILYYGIVGIGLTMVIVIFFLIRLLAKNK